jgi:hypothetical protein
VKRQSKGVRKSSRRRRSKPTSSAWIITAMEQFLALPERTQDIVLALPEAVSLMKSNDISARSAARATGISLRTLLRRGGSALRKLKNGQYVAKLNDRLFRPVIVVSYEGPVEVATNDSREASIAGKHSAAVQRYLETGDDSALRRLPRNDIIDAQGNRVELLIDLDELDRLGSAGELSFESLYVRSR